MGDDRARRGAPDAYFYVVLLLLVALFFSSFATRFLGLRSGNGEFSGGVALLAGQLPYRDYFTAGPPLNTLKSALLLCTFGQNLLVSRIAGVLTRLLLAAAVFRWLRQMFAPREALVSALLTIVLSAGDRTDPVASYNHDALLWGVLAGLMASVALRPSPRRKLMFYGFLAGTAASLSALTKQTVGGGTLLVILIVPTAIFALRSTQLRAASSEKKGAAMLWLLAVGLGAIGPIAVTALTLARLGILRSALLMLFVRGPAAKAGHPSDFFIRMLLVASDNTGWIALGLFWLALGWIPVRLAFRKDGELSSAIHSTSAPRWLVGLLGVGFVVFASAELLRRLPALHDFSKSVVYASSLAEVLLAGVLALRISRLRPFEGSADDWLRQERLLLFATLSVAMSFMLSLSWPAFEAMLLPGLALPVALVLSGGTPRQRKSALAVCAFLAWMQLREKLDLPFGFDLQDEANTRFAKESSVQPELRGLHLPSATVRFVDGTMSLIKAHTAAGDTIFTYPEMDLFYTLSDRHPPTFARSHNMDVVNDTLARSDAARLLVAPPAILITYPETDTDMRGAERLWRRGHPSGERAIVDSLQRLLPNYVAMQTSTLRPGDPPITVYVRRDRLTTATTQ